jgi:hypothetical protein
MNSSLHVFDCAVNPLNFEFVPWLISREMIRRRNGGEPPLRIVFANSDGAEARRPGWLNHVMRPLLSMLGAVEVESRTDPWTADPFLSVEHIEQDIVAGHARGEPVPRFFNPGGYPGAHSLENAPAGSAGAFSGVTITLREAAHWPHRNSNVPEWLAFARELQDPSTGSGGEHVVFLRGYERADEPLENFATCPAASKRLAARMALYSVAKMNFFVSDGPAMLCFFSNNPYVAFMTHYAGANGPQRPWATERQRLVYARDDLGAIREVWEAMAPILSGGRGSSAGTMSVG